MAAITVILKAYPVHSDAVLADANGWPSLILRKGGAG
jgi:hypothetical protein